MLFNDCATNNLIILITQGIKTETINVIKTILHAMIYLPSNKHWKQCKILFIKWAEENDPDVLDCNFVDTYLRDECNFSYAGHLPGEPLSTNRMERSFCSTKDEKKSYSNSAKFTCDFTRTCKAISNHEVYTMQEKLFHYVPIESKQEWQAIVDNSKRYASTSMMCTVFYDGVNHGHISKDKIDKLFELREKSNFVAYLPTKKVITEAIQEVRRSVDLVNTNGIDVRTEAVLNRNRDRQTTTIDELTFREKMLLLAKIGEKLSKFSIKSDEEEDIFEYLNKYSSRDREESKKAQTSNVNYVGRSAKKKKLDINIQHDRKRELHFGKYRSELTMGVVNEQVKEVQHTEQNNNDLQQWEKGVGS